MSSERKLVALSLTVVAFASGIAVSRSFERGVAVVAEQEAEAPAQARGRGESVPPLPSALPDLTAVAERAMLASVNISSTQQVRVDPFFQMFYGTESTVPQTSLGSGVVVSDDGYILTNSHVVVDPRAEIRVTFSDNKEMPARVIGVDPDSDLAVVKVDGRRGQPLPWGDSSRLKAAEWVLAVGNPFQLSQSVSVGVVSAPMRHNPQLALYTDFIQTDAAINRGNSGGALVNGRGELVGINTMIYSETGGFVGIGFAIPTSAARPIMDALIKDRAVIRGSIGGFNLQAVTAEQAREFGLGDQAGVVINSRRMFASDPAARAGMRPGDLILSFNGQRVTDHSLLLRLIADAKIGSTAKVEALRGGKRMSFDVEVVRRTPPPRGR
jgi:S1-C subfamily serine protease